MEPHINVVSTKEMTALCSYHFKKIGNYVAANSLSASVL